MSNPENALPREIEARVFDADTEAVVRQLGALGAAKLSRNESVRAVFDIVPLADPNKWIRLRREKTEGSDKTTLAYKDVTDKAVDGTIEIEEEVEDFDTTLRLLDVTAGIKSRSVQETRREPYNLNGVEISVDEWPKIPKIVEFEGTSEEEIRAAARILGVEDGLTTKRVEEYYLEKLGIDVKTTDLRF